jgi:arginase
MAGISAALERMPEDLAVLWIDAHADVNTPGTSQTGNVHGMPLAALWGLPSGTTGLANAQWERLLLSIGRNALSPNRTCWYGLRDLDPAEQKRVSASAVTMHEIDRVGVEQSISRLIQWVEASGAKGLWVSFDVDVLDPILAPGTGTAVRGGLTYREGHLLAELLHEQLQASEVKMVGLDVVETNPLFDRNNETAKVAVEWIASLFGKTILG